jgi:hypothetical protein
MMRSILFMEILYIRESGSAFAFHFRGSISAISCCLIIFLSLSQLFEEESDSHVIGSLRDNPY